MPSRPTRIILPPSFALGLYTNAFRVVDTAGEHCFLEFLVYSKTENQAQVVGRVSVDKGLLPTLRDAITEVL